jgi:hypothetical protein
MCCAGADMMGVTDRLYDRLGEVADIDAMPCATSSGYVGQVIRR